MNIPTPGHMPYSNLIHDIDNGIIKIPQFQREFVWEKQKSAQLIDSLVKGYPIGTFILWNTNVSLRVVRNIGNITLPKTPEGQYTKYILDGQQRMTSIYACIKGEKVIANKKQVDYSQIYFNLNADIEDGDVIVCDVSQKQPGTYVKVCDLLTMSYSLWSNYEEKYHKKMENYKDRLREYNFSTITITDVPIDIATDIFTRLNVGGKKLSPFEIMSAKAYDDVIGFDLSVKYVEMIEKWKQCGYNTLPSSILLQALSICICGESGRKHILSLEKTDIINNWDKVCAAFDTAIDYFKNYFRIPVSKLIPYEGLLVPFVYFFFRHPKNPDANQSKYLQDYFWRSVLTTRFNEGVDHKLTQDCKNIINKILNSQYPKNEMEVMPVNISPAAIKTNGQFVTRSAYVKGLLCILAANSPESFEDGKKVSLDNSWLDQSNSKNYHHFFPKAYLKKQGVSEQLANNIVNITIIDGYSNKEVIKDKAPSVYMKYYLDNNPQLSSVMETHLIGDLKEYGILDDDYVTFIQKRLERFSKELQKRLKLLPNDIVTADAEEILIEENEETEEQSTENNSIDVSRQEIAELYAKCSAKLISKFDGKIHNSSKKLLVADDKSIAIFIQYSKTYIQGNKMKYWYAYRKKTANLLKDYGKAYIAYICASTDDVVLMPMDELENNIERMNVTNTEKIEDIYWHIVYFKQSDNRFSWLLSKPYLEELNIDEYVMH